MRLIPYRDGLPQKYFADDAMIISCNNGSDMSAKMHKINRWCKNNSKSNSTVVWDSAHHKLYIWFEEPKYRTWFEISGI
jgi:hypothetical protein